MSISTAILLIQVHVILLNFNIRPMLINSTTKQQQKFKCYIVSSGYQLRSHFFCGGLLSIESRPSCGGGSLISLGSTPQMSLAYSEIVLSLENLPDDAMLRTHIFAHCRGSWGKEYLFRLSMYHPHCSISSSK